MTRTYRKTQRAQSEEATRARIVEATMALHEELGPRRTTISAIAGKAGVQRLTVYRHFPDETALFHACTACWLERNPPPDAAAGSDPAALLTALYAYYRRTRAMWTASFRDEAVVPAVQGPMRAFRDHLAGVADELAAGFAGAEARATLGHAVMFPTWSDLADRGLNDGDMARLVLRWAAATRGG